MERIKRARRVIGQLQRMGFQGKRIGHQRVVRLYKQLIEPMWSYCAHLVPWTPDFEKNAMDIQNLAISWVYAKLAPLSKKRLVRLLGLWDAEILRHKQARALHLRLNVAARLEQVEGPINAAIEWCRRDYQATTGIVEEEYSTSSHRFCSTKEGNYSSARGCE